MTRVAQKAARTARVVQKEQERSGLAGVEEKMGGCCGLGVGFCSPMARAVSRDLGARTPQVLGVLNVGSCWRTKQTMEAWTLLHFPHDVEVSCAVEKSDTVHNWKSRRV